jgi:hypothetical protein
MENEGAPLHSPFSIIHSPFSILLFPFDKKQANSLLVTRHSLFAPPHLAFNHSLTCASFALFPGS